jgi:hypothetical protein
MPPSNVVVDGSNIATEGRTTPSLEQLDQAVRQYLAEHPGSSVTVVVDASFGHRIEPSERTAFEQAVAHGELVSPPAGAIGRGDAFLLRIAERIGARVLSNDSFREFHEEHPWLFDEDRLVGGTPVPGVGWIFTPRRPVRGPLTPAAAGGGRRGTRRSKTSDADDRAAAGEVAESEQPEASKPKRSRSRTSKAARSSGGKASGGGVEEAIAQATEEALTPGEVKKEKGRKRQKTEPAPDAVNDPLPFITFASEHPVGSELQGAVVSFTSHGAMALVEDMLCYVPLAGLGVPPPRRARDVLKQGETRTFELVALDPSRRGAQLALPEVVAMHGEIAEGPEEAASEVRGRRKGRARAPSSSASESGETGAPEASTPKDDSPKKSQRTKRPARSKVEPGSDVKATADRPRGALSAKPAKKVTGAKEAAPAKKATAKKTGATKKTGSAKKSAAPKKAAPVNKAAPAKTASVVKKAAPVKKSVPAKKIAKKAAPQKKAAPPRKSADSSKASATRKASAATAKAPKRSGAAVPPGGKRVAVKKVASTAKKSVRSSKKR